MIGTYIPRGLAAYRPMPARSALPLELRSGPNDSPEHGIYEGDCRFLGKLIADNSIDAIICDPVYQYIWQYAWLAQFAARVLKPGASVIAQSGHIHREDAEGVLRNPQLVKRVLLQEQFSGGFGQIWVDDCFRTSQPYIWRTKYLQGAKRLGRRLQTSFWGSKDKSTFSWGDGERAFAFLIERLTKPGDLVLDPFSGTGTVASVCAKMGRRYISFELDPGRVVQSRQRLATAQMPLFVTDTEGQIAMESAA